MNKVLQIPDPHLGAHANLSKNVIGTSINGKLADQLNLLDWIVEKAISEDVDNIIITGDVFESPQPSASLMTHFIAWLNKCLAYNIFVHIIVGNHDILRSGFSISSSLDVINEADLENVCVYKDIETIFIGNSAFTLLPFKDRKSFGSVTNSQALSLIKDVLIYESSSIPISYKKVVIGHFAIEGSIPVGDEIDDIANELFCPVDMFSNYDYVWMGHVHKPQVLNKSNPYVAHIGSMDISNFGEIDHKKIIVIYDCESGEFENITLPTRNLKKITISVPKDSKDSTQYVLDELKKQKSIDKSIIKVEISLESQDLLSVNKSKIEKYLNERGAFTVAGIHESKKLSIIKRDVNNNISTGIDIQDAIKKYSSTYIKEENKEGFISLSMEIFKQFKAENPE